METKDLVVCNFQYTKRIGVLKGEPRGTYEYGEFDVVQDVEYENWICCQLKQGHGRCDQWGCIFFRRGYAKI